jgi:hypothetical protein
VSRRQYRARILRAQDGTLIGWGVFLTPAGIIPSMAACFTGPFAWWRAARHASALNRRSWQ